METERQGTFKWIYVAIAVVLVLVTICALLFAMQEHKDRVLSEEISQTASEVQETGARITSIRDADMKDMNDYIRPFSEIRPLLDTYDGELQRITDLYNQARERDKRLRGVEGLYRKPHFTNWESMSEILDITRALGKVMRQEASVIQNMAQLRMRNERSSGTNGSCRSKHRKRDYAPSC